MNLADFRGAQPSAAGIADLILECAVDGGAPVSRPVAPGFPLTFDELVDGGGRSR